MGIHTEHFEVHAVLTLEHEVEVRVDEPRIEHSGALCEAPPAPRGLQLVLGEEVDLVDVDRLRFISGEESEQALVGCSRHLEHVRRDVRGDVSGHVWRIVDVRVLVEVTESTPSSQLI
jgi:hypothetical protein